MTLGGPKVQSILLRIAPETPHCRHLVDGVDYGDKHQPKAASRQLPVSSCYQRLRGF